MDGCRPSFDGLRPGPVAGGDDPALFVQLEQVADLVENGESMIPAGAQDEFGDDQEDRDGDECHTHGHGGEE